MVEQCCVDTVGTTQIEDHDVFPVEVLTPPLHEATEDSLAVCWGLVVQIAQRLEVSSGIGSVIDVTKLGFPAPGVRGSFRHAIPFLDCAFPYGASAHVHHGVNLLSV
jgi:hypothetical protein